eukprot:TRINITY_DN33775_c0_g2_i1.p1 TRINITY_DN33775_c0_g2~~TRINITY_DN33775_c0_g2_i1.p1  ORF type:complete len:732 (-),score=125.10 TRINITY_DN33775_c0_g2_i1:136-2331(-)
MEKSADVPKLELLFVQWLVAPDVGFWQELMRRKLDMLRLDDSPIGVHGFYEVPSNVGSSDKCFFSACSFDDSPSFPSGASMVRGEINNFNTAEEFRTYLKSEARSEKVAQLAQSLRDDIVSGAVLKNPLLLRPFVAVVFADLKKYVFSYTMSFPVLSPATSWPVREMPCGDAAGAASIGFNREQLCEISRQLRDDTSRATDGVFLLTRASADEAWRVRPLADLIEFSSGGVSKEDVVVAFVDPCLSEGSFGWPLRNVLLAVAHHRPDFCYILAFRDMLLCSRGAEVPSRSRMLILDSGGEVAKTLLSPTPPAQARFAGWSKIQSVDLTTFLDKRRMAADAVDLNVKLMKWRLIPELEPGKLKEMRFLLLGSGTLGCSLARVLMGWGVRKMTFVDSGKVGLSNPVRQSLFTHQDAADSRSKAQAARQAVLAVMPDADIVAVEMEIPMPGHPHQSAEVLARSVEQLQKLVGSHDVVCMLTDSRESRWLPSLLVAASQTASVATPLDPPQGAEVGGGKRGGYEEMTFPGSLPQGRRPEGPPLGITVALGFDSFLVSRQTYLNVPSACYFCNDLTAPADSLAFRTLDQQCTVTRPGLSSLAAGVAAELVAALSQHRDGFAARCCLAAGCNRGGAASAAGVAPEPSLLGSVPHQVRGYLADFRLAPVETEPSSRCVCCSPGVLGRFSSDGIAFIQRVVKDSAELEQVSGLAEMKAAVREDEVLSFDEFDDDGDSSA